MTDQRKTPELVAASVEGSKQYNLQTNYRALSPRLKRLALALLAAGSGLPREACDRVTPCSNSPEYVSQLRERLGLCIPCIRQSFVTADGFSSSYGIYHLTESDRQKLTSAIN